MKFISFILLSMLFLSCADKRGTSNEPLPAPKDSLQKPVPTSNTDTTTWINSFRDFRNAVYQNNRDKIKQFISFPVMNENNELWMLIHEDDAKALDKITSEIKPFTEKDFDKYYKKLFPKSFINTVLKIKTEDLYKKGDCESAEVKEGDAIYKMYGSVDKAAKMITLNLAGNTITKDKDGVVQDAGEFNIIYQFSILDNSQIKLKQVRLAG